MDHANGNEKSASVTAIDVTSAPVAAPRQEQAAHAPTLARRHVHGSVLEGGDSPAVLAQPAAALTQGQGSAFHPDRRAARAARAAKAARRAQRAIEDARDNMTARYRRASDTTDDFVHDNPWKSIALAALGGLIVGLLASR